MITYTPIYTNGDCMRGGGAEGRLEVSVEFRNEMSSAPASEPHVSLRRWGWWVTDFSSTFPIFVIFPSSLVLSDMCGGLGAKI